ncbi:conjugal transfer protein TrbI [Xanthomonas citri pv. fuscans]|uniref:Conjugal transfer protein TrbI n=5 Tax=Xanthomonas TaxID=338 RepID=A0AAX2HFB7_XANCI|nr:MULTISPECIES: TrbI/VirB10 family protein [Xanthomonas]ATS28399.1 TrbI/VirB10 family protein [Xanthomonas phaseoli pv. phaseoli]ATS32390.1 TrbI/VirB10 family protein [Xanthomonas phaseoli pv. phaseoli]ATS40972.1 TrbI/VirB10 family protein [Xanthomonas citri pv. phaseoli var. fuscans]ATS45194.1 TrbI/VirB10 family protein [Xanthomonas citri pv. phaseoli var. fuscans]ATS49450.1 TrbI/VirB10 family protein [Xanthomonas citri pv. phaseoli var. fuscans]
MQTTNGTPADDERDPVTGESASEGYTPPQDAPIPLATPKPKIKTLDKKKVGIIAGIAGVLIAFAFVQAFTQKPNQNKPKEQPATANMSTKPEAFNALPGDYATAAQQRAERVPKLGAPMPGEVGQMQYATQQQASTRAYGGGAQPQTAAQQFAAQQDLQRMQQAANARYAKTSFQQSARPGAAGNPSQFGGPPAFGGMPADSPEAVQQQMLAQAAAAAAGAGGPDKTARDDANRQDDKRHFMDEKRDTGTLQSRLTPPATPTVVSAGTLIPALFLTGINSDLPGQITAQVSQPVYDTPTGRYVIIPQGSVLIGAYDSRVTFGQNRVLLVWQRLRFPNGSSLDLEGMPGVDLSGYAGVSDKVNNHWGKVLSSVLLSSTVAAAVATAEGDSFSAFQRDAGQAASQGAAQQINQAGSQLLQRSINVQPTLEIRPGQRVAVMVNKDLALSPYGP